MHRVAFGLFLTVAFSGGVAAVLIGIGLAMVYARRFAEGAMMQRWLPLASSAVIPSSAWHWRFAHSLPQKYFEARREINAAT
jgi:hypothetical protein